MAKHWTLLLIFSLLLVPGRRVLGQDLATRKGEITSLVDGQALRGIVSIQGNTLVEGFISWELNFGYADDTRGTWFLIAESDQPVMDDLLSEWNTTQIIDGTYNLRLTLYLEEGRRAHTTVRNLRVRNYSPIETDTPVPTRTATPFTETPLPSQTATQAQPPTATAVPPSATPLPTNSLEIAATTLSNSMMRGAAGALAAFILIGLYTTLKKTLQQ